MADRERPTQCHEEMVLAACRWLKKTKRCGLVFAEPGKNVCSEEPDALGFRTSGLHSMVVECKTSRSDFLADAKKPHRRHGGMGVCRWYLVPTGMVKPEEVPEGWGLLYLEGKKVREVLDAPLQADRNMRDEMTWLYCVALRHQKGVPWVGRLYRFAPQFGPNALRDRAAGEEGHHA